MFDFSMDKPCAAVLHSTVPFRIFNQNIPIFFWSQGSSDFNMLDKDVVSMDNCILAMPPRQSSEEFLEAYEVVLILDDRENFGFV